MQLNPSEMRGRDVYRLMTSVLVPRPVAWVGSRSPEGIDNLAPFSYFMGVGSRPPLIAFSVARADRLGTLKDTARNVLARQELTVSIASEEHLNVLHASGARFPPEVSEIEALGLTSVPGEIVSAPRVGEAPIGMECRLERALDLEQAHLFLVEVLRFHVADRLLTPDGVVDEIALRPIVRLGPSGYASLGNLLVPDPVEAG